MLMIVGVVVLVVGLIGIGWGIFQNMRAGRLGDAPLVSTADAALRGAQVAAPNGAISVQGNVVCERPLVSPVTGTQCLYFTITATAYWRNGDDKKSETIANISDAAGFALDDGSGPVWIDATQGGDFEPEQSRSEIKRPGLIGEIIGTELVFGNYRISTGAFSSADEYEVTEKVLPLVPQLYACGQTRPRGIAPPEWRSLILSNRSRDQLIASASQGAKLFLLGGAAVFGVGAITAVLGHLHEVKTAAPPHVANTRR